MNPNDRKYTKQHEWIQVGGKTARVGITHYAQEQLTDIVFVELPEVGKKVSAGESAAELESVKSVSDLYAPASGTVTEINTALTEAPEKVNEAPFGEGWIFALELSDPKELDQLMDAAQYQAYLDAGGH
ncbi:MAG: glycine cleavage system protein GcvH [Deltaproteobacteria bacterium]|nr:glycine cleavage system protein GcvH [Deltaproteobacteria bacterium]MDH4122035.1 glycine cleavage system protein GcvH [Deltaproteobacteria bacterium]